MDLLHERFASIAGPLLPLLLDAAIKGAALLALTAVAALAMRRASAAARHLVWFLAISALLVMPIFSTALPAWHILPNWSRPPAPAPRRGEAAGFPLAQVETPPPHPGQPIPQNEHPSPAYPPPIWNPALPSTLPSPAPTPPATPPTTPIVQQPAAQPPPQVLHPLTWQAKILLAWLAGTVLYAGYVLFGCLSLYRLSQKSSPIADPAWSDLLRQARQSLGFHRPVNLISHPRRGMPMTWGLWRAWILIPEDAAQWPAEQRRAVLLHELAHARRWDCLTQLITQLAIACYWFNPLAWLAWKRIQTEREQACDDLVLSTGQRASAYAEQLLHLAADLPALHYPAAIAMARPGRLEQRLVAILDPHRRRRLATRTALFLCLAAALSAAIVATLRAEEVITDPALIAVTKWAHERGWKAQPVAKTNLETWDDGWRNLPFMIDPAEEADAKACMKLGGLAGSTVNGVSQFGEPSTADALKSILQHRPHYFYAEFLLAQWNQDNGQPLEAERLREAAYRDAPAVIAQRYAFADGTPLADTPIDSCALECNRVQHGYLDPSLELSYHDLCTDADGCIYLPVYNTVFRRDEMADPDGYSVVFPTLGWFQTSRKVGMLPVATVTEKPGDFVSSAQPTDPPTTRAALPGGIVADLMGVHRYAPTTPAEMSPSLAANGWNFQFGFSKSTAAGDAIKFRFSVPNSAASYPTEIINQRPTQPYVVFASLPTHPKQVSIQIGLGRRWKRAASCDPQLGKIVGTLPDGFSLRPRSKNALYPGLAVVHPQTDLEVRVLAIDSKGQEHTTSEWGTEETNNAGSPEVFADRFGFDMPAANIASYRVEVRSYQWAEFDNIALVWTGQAPQTQPATQPAASAPAAATPSDKFAIVQWNHMGSASQSNALLVGTVAAGSAHIVPLPIPTDVANMGDFALRAFLGVADGKLYVLGQPVRTVDLRTGKIADVPGGRRAMPAMQSTDPQVHGDRRLDWGAGDNPAYADDTTRPFGLQDLLLQAPAGPTFVLSEKYTEPPHNVAFPTPPTVWLDDSHALTLQADHGDTGDFQVMVIDLAARSARPVGRISGWPNTLIPPCGNGGDAIVIANSNDSDGKGHNLAKTYALDVASAIAGTGKLEQRPIHWGDFTLEGPGSPYEPNAIDVHRLLHNGKELASDTGGELIVSVSPDGHSALWQIRPPHFTRNDQLYFYQSGQPAPQQLATTGEFGMPVWFTASADAPPASPLPQTQPATQPALRDPWGEAVGVLRYRLIPPAGPISKLEDVTAKVEVQNIGEKTVTLSDLGSFWVRVADWQWREFYTRTAWTAADPKTGGDTGKPVGPIPAGGSAVLICHLNNKLPESGKYELVCSFSDRRPYFGDQPVPLPVPLFVVDPGENAPPDIDPTDFSPKSWGPAVDHMHARLRVFDPVHDTGNIDDLTLDLRNVGNRQLAFDPSVDAMELEIDGHRYHAVSTTERVNDLLPFGPGYRWDNWGNGYNTAHLEIYPTADWRDADNHSLKLAHGKHTVRLAITLPPMPGSGETPVRLLTNTVDRNITRDFGSAKALPFINANQPAPNGPQPDTQPAASVMPWFGIFPVSTVKSITDFRPPFVIYAQAGPNPAVPGEALVLEIRSANNGRRVADLPSGVNTGRYMDFTGGISLDADQLRRAGKIPDGDYLAALITHRHMRCSNVIRFKIDAKYIPAPSPALRVEPMPLGPGEKLPTIWVVGTGPKPMDEHFTNASAMFPTLFVDGVQHDPVIPPMSMPVGPIPAGQSFAECVRLADFTPPIPPKAQYRVKAKTAGYESAEVTVPAADSLGPAWDAATSGLAPLSPAIPELRGTVIGADGKPAAGAEIMLQGPIPSGSPAATEHCDLQGNYSFVNLPPGKYFLWVEPLRIDGISLQPGKTLVQDFSSVERFKLTGQVTYRNGAPAAGKSVDVTATSDDGRIFFDASAITDALGRYSVATPFNHISGVDLERATDQGPFPAPVYDVKASAAPVNLVIPANPPGTTQPAEADLWGNLRPGLAYRLSTPHDPWPIYQKPIVWLEVKNTANAAHHLLDGGTIELRLTGLPKNDMVRLTYPAGKDMPIMAGDSVTFAITFHEELAKPGQYPVQCEFEPNPKDAAHGKDAFRACPPLILAAVAPAGPLASQPATQPGAASEYEKMLYALGAFPVAKLTKHSWDNGEPGKVYAKGERVDVDGWLPPGWVEDGDYLTDAEKARYGIPVKPLTVERYLGMMNVAEYERSHDPLLLLVMRFSLQAMQKHHIAVKKEDILRIYEAGIGLEGDAVDLLRGRISSADAMRLLRTHKDERLFDVIPAPTADDAAYDAFLEDQAKSGKWQLSSRQLCFRLLWEMDPKTYRQPYRQFLLDHVATAEDSGDRGNLYDGLIGLKDDESFAAVRHGLTHDPSTECRNSMLYELQNQGVIAPVMDAILIIASGKDEKHSYTEANAPGAPVGDTAGGDPPERLDAYLKWAKAQPTDPATAAKIAKAIGLLAQRH